MADDFDSEEEKESGTSLRKKLETTLGENAKLKEQLVELAGKQLITEKGYKLVSVEDLKGVSLSELETKAQELETQKAAAEAETVRRVLASKGLADSKRSKRCSASPRSSSRPRPCPALRAWVGRWAPHRRRSTRPRVSSVGAGSRPPTPRSPTPANPYPFLTGVLTPWQQVLSP